MNIRWLKDFITLADYQKFTVAAQVCSSSQAAFSRRIQQLEQHLQVKLFNRKRTPIKLTPEGQRLYPIAQELIEIAENCKLSIKSKTSPVVIASLHTLACNFFPQWFGQIYRSMENPVLTHIDSGIRSISSYQTSLRSGRADCILFYNTEHYQAFFPHNEFEIVKVSTDKLIWVCGSNFDKQLLNTASIPYMSYAKSAQLAELSQPLLERTPATKNLHQIFQSTVSEALIPMLQQNIAIACVPSSSAEKHLMNKSLTQIWPEYTEMLNIVLIRLISSIKENTESDRFFSYIKNNIITQPKKMT